MDSVFPCVNNRKVDIITKLNIHIITAAEQQTMNYYMNVAPLYNKSDLGRRMYQEIGLIEEEHVSQYESLKDANASWLEDLLLHEYTECYLYYSCYQTECDSNIRCIWEDCLLQEISHLHKAKELLYKYERKDWHQVIPNGTFPDVLTLQSNIDYVQKVLATTVGNTQCGPCVVPLHDLPDDAPFYQYQDIVNHDVRCVPTHEIINAHIKCKGIDCRYQTAPNPIPQLQNRREDNVTLARIPDCTPKETTVCGTTKNNCQCSDTTCDGKQYW